MVFCSRINTNNKNFFWVLDPKVGQNWDDFDNGINPSILIHILILIIFATVDMAFNIAFDKPKWSLSQTSIRVVREVCTKLLGSNGISKLQF